MARDSAFEIDPEELLRAYSLGYFPMARRRDDPGVVWVLPDFRGVLELSEARAPRRLKKFIAGEPFEVRVDTAFVEVIQGCAAPAPGREDTWINAAIETVYTELHHMGRAHSVECWADGELCGGVYGVAVGGVFCGESMFSRRTNASKVALAYLIHRLKAGGFRLLDTQFHTQHLAQFGVREVPNDAYQAMLAEAQRMDADFNRAPAYSSTTSVLQSITQTS